MRRQKPNLPKRYSLDQSPLYKVKSINQLAQILGTDRKTINYLTSSTDNYIRFTTAQDRDIQWPKPSLRKIQKRAGNLLGRIETPYFLHSARKGKSYITNAAEHSAVLPGAKVDIKKFFQSVRAPAVYHFFLDKMLCEPDVAAVLAKLFTVDRHLPTGGNTSPILSYFAYMDMFSEIEALAKQRGCAMTCFMDDMTFTGPGATRKLIYEVRSILCRYRLWAHKTKLFKSDQTRVITGVAVTTRGLRVPNKRQQAIAKDLEQLSKARSGETCLEILQRVIGRTYEAAQIDAAWRPRAVALVARRRTIARRTLAEATTVKKSLAGR
jgi:RNA-directed DNA polymerase